MSDVWILVLAAGAGTRFGGRKQFLDIAPGHRLVDAAVDVAYEACDNVVLVLPIGTNWDGRPVSGWTYGGKTRLLSIRNGLAMVDPNARVVVIHDASHPLAPVRVFRDVIDAVLNGADAAVPYLPLNDVVKAKEEDSGLLRTIGRDGWGLAQVPMGFAWDALMEAYESGGDLKAWEESMLVEQRRGNVTAVPGSPRNVHVVSREDLEVARDLFRATSWPVAQSSGRDTRR